MPHPAIRFSNDMEGCIPFLLDETAHRIGIESWLSLDYKRSPHILWAGRTGSGKTVAAKILLARTILLAPPELQPVELTLADPKEDSDFDFLNGLPRFYRGDAAPRGFDDFYAAFLARKEGQDLSNHLKVFFVDEFASLVGMIEDKKTREATQQRLFLLLSLSRSRNFSIQLATQQPSAQIFGANGSASREQFGVVCQLGDCEDSEGQKMLFGSSSRERIAHFGSIGGRGVGWLSINGGTAQPVRVPFVQDMDKLNKILYDNLAIEREADGGAAQP